MNVARRHHTVPRFLLERFARGGRIGTVRLPGDKRFIQSVANASINTNFYTMDTIDPSDSDEFEQSLSSLEGTAANVLRSILDENVWPLSAEDRGALVTFCAVQYLRGPDQRTMLEQIVAATTKLELSVAGRDSIFEHAKEKLGREISEEEADRLWADVTSPSGPPITVRPHVHIEQILRALPEIYPFFAGRPWLLVRFDRKKLVTCDTPIALIRDVRANPGPVGLINAWGISLAISRTAAIVMVDPLAHVNDVNIADVANGTFDMSYPASTQLARMINDSIMRNARSWIFHHPDDGSIVGSNLQPPRTVEIAIPDDDYVAMGESMRAAMATDTEEDFGTAS